MMSINECLFTVLTLAVMSLWMFLMFFLSLLIFLHIDMKKSNSCQQLHIQHLLLNEKLNILLSLTTNLFQKNPLRKLTFYLEREAENICVKYFNVSGRGRYRQTPITDGLFRVLIKEM